MMRKRKIITRAIVFVLAGAIVNVAVAWGCASRAPSQFSIYTGWFAPHVDRIYVESLLAASGYVSGGSSRADEWREFGVRTVSVPNDSDSLTDHVFAFFGWPVASMRYHILWGSEVLCVGGIKTGIERFQHHTNVHALPLRPIWPGFAINTIFYAAILWLLFAAPGFVRKRRRIKCGLCPACAYPVGASELCTECGKPLR